MRILLLGPPGAAKGDAGKSLMTKHGLVHVSTGDMLRASIEVGSDIGQKAHAIMEAGLLVPDEVVTALIKSRLQTERHGLGFSFDGYPRTRAQAESLDSLLANPRHEA